jgi:hypothetical protein
MSDGHPAVDEVLELIQSNWAPGSFSDIPLERIDRDTSTLLDGNIRSRTEDLQQANYVGASFADAERTPIGADYDHELEAVVGVRIEGLHVDYDGLVDPEASMPPANAGDPVPWFEDTTAGEVGLVKAIRDAIMQARTFPSTGQQDIAYLDIQITNDTPASSDLGDYFRRDFDVVFRGFEELP